MPYNSKGQLVDGPTDDEVAEPALVPWFNNHYRHCGVEWTMEWDATCDDDCPKCGHDITPYKSDDLPNWAPPASS